MGDYNGIRRLREITTASLGFYKAGAISTLTMYKVGNKANFENILVNVNYASRSLRIRSFYLISRDWGPNFPTLLRVLVKTRLLEQIYLPTMSVLICLLYT